MGSGHSTPRAENMGAATAAADDEDDDDVVGGGDVVTEVDRPHSVGLKWRDVKDGWEVRR